MKKEYILCAAIWYHDLETQRFLPANCEKGVVICGWRHSNCTATLTALTGKNRDEIGDYTQGFITSKNRFVDRTEAAKIALENKQILHDREMNKLYTEDLY